MGEATPTALGSTTWARIPELPEESWATINGDPIEIARGRSIAVDIETEGLDNYRWNVTAVIVSNETHAYVLDPASGTSRGRIREALTAASELVFHNAPFDVPVLVDAGLMDRADVTKVYDTLVSARMATPSEMGGRSLGDSCEHHVGGGYKTAKKALETAFKKVHPNLTKSEMFKVLNTSEGAFVFYAAMDGIMTARLRAVINNAVFSWTGNHPFDKRRLDRDATYRLIDREQMINRVLLETSVDGITVDMDVVDELRVEAERTIDRTNAELEAHDIDTSLSRNKMKPAVVDVLDSLGVIPADHPRLKNGKPSAAKTALAHIDHPLVRLLAERTQAERFYEDYGLGAGRKIHRGKIHPATAVMAARTGRMSMKDPPLQQYPPAVRRMLTFDGPVSSLDWSSIEPMFAGNVFGQEEWIAGFEDGADLYEPVASAAGVDRTTAKVVLLAQLYGQGVASLAKRLGQTEDDARKIIHDVMEPLDRVRAGSEAVKDIAERFGKIQTMSGRIVPQDIDHRTGGKRYKGYVGVNHLVQGSCYDLLAEVIYTATAEGLGPGIHIALHDELVVDTEIADDIARIMTTPPPDLCEMAKRTPKLRIGRADLGAQWNEK